MTLRTALLLSAAFLVLSGCANTPPPEPRIVTVEVKVPVPVVCKAHVKRDAARYADQDAATLPDIFSQTRALLVGIEQRKAMEARFIAAITGCGGTVE